MGFRIPFGEWLRGDLRALPGEVLLDPRALDRGLFREERLREIVAEHLDGSRDHALQDLDAPTARALVPHLRR